ncbi:MAG: regulatory protein RecX [Ectothiorhodospira sp.]
MRLLARREHSRLELLRKLAARGYPATDVEAALDRLEAQGLLSETRFAESLVRQRIQQGHGPLRILADLHQRGVEDPRAAVEAAEVDWEALAREVYQRRFGDDTPQEATERARRMRFLNGRGFSPETIRRVMSDVDTT